MRKGKKRREREENKNDTLKEGLFFFALGLLRQQASHLTMKLSLIMVTC